MVADLSLARGHALGASGGQGSQGHPKEPCRDLRLLEGNNGTPSPPLPPLCPQLLSSNSVRESTERSPPKHEDLGKDIHIFIISFSPAVVSTCWFFSSSSFLT